jgi:hypothetical protein
MLEKSRTCLEFRPFAASLLLSPYLLLPVVKYQTLGSSTAVAVSWSSALPALSLTSVVMVTSYFVFFARDAVGFNVTVRHSASQLTDTSSTLVPVLVLTSVMVSFVRVVRSIFSEKVALMFTPRCTLFLSSSGVTLLTVGGVTSSCSKAPMSQTGVPSSSPS